jgi:hypothetical protein
MIGFISGAVAALAMAIPMFMGVLMEMEGMPVPFPLAFVKKLSTTYRSDETHLYMAIAAHLVYGGVWGAALAVLTERPSTKQAIQLSMLLFGIMMVAVGILFGMNYPGSNFYVFTVSAFFFHMIYGVALGWLLGQSIDY